MQAFSITSGLIDNFRWIVGLGLHRVRTLASPVRALSAQRLRNFISSSIDLSMESKHQRPYLSAHDAVPGYCGDFLFDAHADNTREIRMGLISKFRLTLVLPCLDQ